MIPLRLPHSSKRTDWMTLPASNSQTFLIDISYRLLCMLWSSAESISLIRIQESDLEIYWEQQDASPFEA